MDREEHQTQTINREAEISVSIDPCPPDQGTIDRVLGGAHHDPHSVLGAHPHPDGTAVRVLRPHADEVLEGPEALGAYLDGLAERLERDVLSARR